MGEQRGELEGGALLRSKAYLPANLHQAIQSGTSKTNLYILLFEIAVYDVSNRILTLNLSRNIGFTLSLSF